MPRIAPIHYRRLVRVLEREGFAIVRERGDHLGPRQARDRLVLPGFLIASRNTARKACVQEITGSEELRLKGIFDVMDRIGAIIGPIQDLTSN